MKQKSLFTTGTLDEHFYIDKSTIPNAGKGLFTKKFIKKGEIISYFAGDLIDEKEATKRNIGVRGHYFIQLSSGKILDTYHHDSFARWANDAKNKKKNNAKIYSSDCGELAYISSNKNIEPGSEIFTDYGVQYWADVRLANETDM